MAQNITLSYRTLVDEALAKIETIQPQDAVQLHGRDDVVLVDIRDIRELKRAGRPRGGGRGGAGGRGKKKKTEYSGAGRRSGAPRRMMCTCAGAVILRGRPRKS